MAGKFDSPPKFYAPAAYGTGAEAHRYQRSPLTGEWLWMGSHR